ncbi:MAG: primosomal protein N' [Coriobacteriia bacterium]|nr:primosomal protein N' [Coriobacteriia bacterium]
MLLANVVLDIQSSSLNKPFTYIAPKNASVGKLVMVPFGHQYKCGFIVDVFDGEGDNLKKIKKIVSKSYFDEDSIEFAKFISTRYMAPLASCIRLFTPPGSIAKCKKIDGEWQLIEPQVKETFEDYVLADDNFKNFVPRDNAVKQRQIIHALKQGEVKKSELALEYGSVTQVLKSLEAEGVVKIERRRRIRDVKTNIEQVKDFDLTDGQKDALNIIKNSGNRKFVIDGITGSGKTEIYIRAIQEELKKEKSAIVLVPEISLTPQTVARFRSRFGDTVAVLHSKMSAGERFDQWDLLLQGQAKVVVGARSALFAPVKNLGIIVIDEEHESSYKQESLPRYVTRDCAEYLADQKNAKLILGSATPSIEALYKTEYNPEWTRIFLPERTNKLPMPKIKVVDMGMEFKSGSTALFSQTLKHELEQTISKGQKAVLLHNRRGFANYMFCRECGYIPMCDHCSTSLTYHARLQTENGAREMLMCHHCGHLEFPTAKCPKCGSPYFAKLGAGTQSVEDQLHELFPDVKIVRMDADTTRKKDGHLKCLEEFAMPGPAVLLGTQMIAKGLDFDDVTLVGVILADTNLSLPDFRSEERTFNLISQVAGRAGRANLPGRVVVQTYNPDNNSIRCAANYDRSSFLSEQFQKRELLKYPPYTRLINLIVYANNEDDAESATKDLCEHLNRYNAAYDFNWDISGPNVCVLAKIRGQYRYHILIKSSSGDKLSDDLSKIMEKYKTRKNISLQIDVDPTSLY